MTMRKHTFYGILALVSLLGLGITQSARAYSVTLQQVGSNVVASGSGPINLTGLTFFLPGIDFTARIRAGGGVIITGPPGGSGDVDTYTGFTGPTSFGSGFFFFPNTGSGDIVGITGGGLLAVQPGYVSGAALSDSMTFNNATFASLGVTPGTYLWSWGTGLPNQNFTLIIGGVGVPDGGSTVSLLGFALLGLVALRRKLSC